MFIEKCFPEVMLKFWESYYHFKTSTKNFETALRGKPITEQFSIDSFHGPLQLQEIYSFIFFSLKIKYLAGYDTPDKYQTQQHSSHIDFNVLHKKLYII